MNVESREWLQEKILNSDSHRRFLTHLSRLPDNKSRWEARWVRTQPGVAEALGVVRTRISAMANDSLSVGFVESRVRHIIERPNGFTDGCKRIAYFITSAGLDALKP
jgi:hypothetical protein